MDAIEFVVSSSFPEVSANVLVIGAGLSGAACAYALAQRGACVQVLADEREAGASSLPVGLLAAHVATADVSLSVLSRLGVARSLAYAQTHLREGMDYQRVRLRQKLLHTPQRRSKLLQHALQTPDWFVADEDDLLHLQAAWVKPQALVASWLAQRNIVFRQTRAVTHIVKNGQDWQARDRDGQLLAQAQHMILAAGVQTLDLAQSAGTRLRINGVYGQVAHGVWPGFADALAINGHGHFIAGIPQDACPTQKFWLSGSTYERMSYPNPGQARQAGLLANRARMQSLLDAELMRLMDTQFSAQQVKTWSGRRCTTTDRLPAVGQIAPGLWVCTGLGSRGLSSALLCAEVLADELSGQSDPNATKLPADLREEIDVCRLID